MQMMATRRLFLKTASSAGMAPVYKGEKRTRAEVRVDRGVPTLFINGEPQLPYLYYFPVPVKEYIRDFARAGVSILTWGYGSVIDHCLDMGWKGPGEYDYRDFDRQVEAILDAHSSAYLIPRIAVSAPGKWLEANPDSRFTHEDGTQPKIGRQGHFLTSIASKRWLAAATEALERFIDHVSGSAYVRHIIGYHITGGVNEWFYSVSEYTDHSPAFKEAYGDWLREQYSGDPALLRSAWKISGATFDDPRLPGLEDLLKTDFNLLRDPSMSRWTIDYSRFISESTARALIHLCGVAKRRSAGESLAGPFYGYVVNATAGFANGHSPVNWGHQALKQVFEAPEVDFLCAPYPCTFRGAGSYDGSQSVEGSAQLHGKLFFAEVDSPTFVSKPSAWFMFGKPLPTAAQSIATLTRDFSHRLTKRRGMWWMDLVPNDGWYHHPDLMRVISRCRHIASRAMRLDISYRPEVAVIFDTDASYYLKPGAELLLPLVHLQDRIGLARMGTTYDIYLHDDLALDSMPEYRLYIFINTLYLNNAERDVIKRRIRQEGKTALWIYGPGILSENGLSADTMYDLTGIRLTFRRADFVGSLGSRLYLTDFEHPITRELGELPYFGTDSRIGPLVYADDPEAQILGRLLPVHATAARGEWPGFVIKRFPDWTSIFIGAPNVPAPLLRGIAKYAGCHIYSTSGDIVYANNRFLALHSGRTGVKRIALRSASAVYDAFTERRVAGRTAEIVESIPYGATRLYYLGEISDIADAHTRLTSY